MAYLYAVWIDIECLLNFLHNSLSLARIPRVGEKGLDTGD